MNEEQKKQINDAIELMKSFCNRKYCNIDNCPLWWICGEYVYDMKKLD